MCLDQPTFILEYLAVGLEYVDLTIECSALVNCGPFYKEGGSSKPTESPWIWACQSSNAIFLLLVARGNFLLNSQLMWISLCLSDNARWPRRFPNSRGLIGYGIIDFEFNLIGRSASFIVGKPELVPKNKCLMPPNIVYP